MSNVPSIQINRWQISSNWIVSARYDLLFFSGSFLAGFLYMALYYFTGADALLLFLAFYLLFDVPHVFNTLFIILINRTCEKTKLFILSYLFFFLGPLSLLMSTYFNSRIPFNLFTVFASLYGTWHIFRQHYGFISMYQQKNGEKVGFQNKFEFYVFHFVFCVGAILIHLRSVDLGIYQVVSRFTYFPELYLTLQIIFNIFVALFLLENVVKFLCLNERLNLPKVVFSNCCFFLLIFLVNSEMVSHIEYVLFLAIFTIHHNIQYSALVYYYGQNNFLGKSLIQRLLTKNIFYFAFIGISISIIYKYSIWYVFGSRIPSNLTPVKTTLGSIVLFENLSYTVQDFALIFFFGKALQHYYLDQKIWKIKSIKSELKL